MDDFIFYSTVGLRHVLDWKAYDHILFFIVLTVFYSLKDWKKGVFLITAFTIGHTLSLVLSVYKIIEINTVIIEFLIPLTICITAIYNILTIKISSKNIKITTFFAFIFGLIHGLGFSNYFKILIDDYESKLIPLLAFATGIEMAQIILVSLILALNFMALNILRRNKRDWILVTSSIVIGIVIPMLIERKFW